MEITTAATIFAAISQPSRLAIVRLLIEKGPGGESAGGISDELAIRKPTLSFHLRELQNAGLVQARRDGRHIIYAADYGGLRTIIDFLLADCCGGDKRLCGPYVIKEIA